MLGRGEAFREDAVDRSRRWPRTDRFFMDSLSPPVSAAATVDMLLTEDASESSPSPPPRPNRPVAVVLVLFFLGIGGSTFPGSSILSCLCNAAKSPYLRPRKCSNSPFLFTRKRNSCGMLVIDHGARLVVDLPHACVTATSS